MLLANTNPTVTVTAVVDAPRAQRDYILRPERAYVALVLLDGGPLVAMPSAALVLLDGTALLPAACTAQATVLVALRLAWVTRQLQQTVLPW